MVQRLQQPMPTPAAGMTAPLDPLWLGVVTVGGVVAWSGVYEDRAAAQAAVLTRAREYLVIPASGDIAADWAALQTRLAAEDDGRQAPLGCYLGPVTIVPASAPSQAPP